MAAIAIDLGAGWSERRIDQTAADLAALGGGLEALLTVTGDPLQAAVDEVKRLVDQNLGRAVPAADWASCQDPNRLARPSNLPILNISGGTDCISFSAGFTSLRVRIPGQEVPMTFARVLGVEGLQVHAAAEVGLNTVGGVSYPAGLFAGQGAGTQVCIKTGTNPNPQNPSPPPSSPSTSCGSPSAGGFGTFLPYYYTEVNSNPPPSTIGITGNQTDPLARVIANGIDHEFGLASGLNAGTRLNGANCGGNPTVCGPAFPDRVEKSSGNQPPDISQGLIKGGSWYGSYEGRLARGPFVGFVDEGAAGSFTILTESVDNRPLWTFIDSAEASTAICQAIASLPTYPSFPTTVDGFNFDSWQHAADRMGECLAGEPGLLFDDTILESSRLATVPRFWQVADCGNNNCIWDIREIVPIFIQGIWTPNSGSWTCSSVAEHESGDYCVHHPGMIGSITRNNPSSANVDSASALVIACHHIPNPPCVLPPDGSGGQSRNIAIRLTK